MSFDSLNKKFQEAADELNAYLDDSCKFNVDIWITGVTLEFERPMYKKCYDRKVKLAYRNDCLSIIDDNHNKLTEITKHNITRACISNNILYIQCTDALYSYEISANWTLTLHTTITVDIKGYWQNGYIDTLLVHDTESHIISFYDKNFTQIKTIKYHVEKDQYMYIGYSSNYILQIIANNFNSCEKTVSASIATLDGVLIKHLMF